MMQHAPESEILCPRIENVFPVQLVFNLGSMLPILKIALCMEISIFYESMVKEVQFHFYIKRRDSYRVGKVNARFFVLL